MIFFSIPFILGGSRAKERVCSLNNWFNWKLAQLWIGGSHNMLFMFKGSRVLIVTCKNSCDLKIVFVLLPDSAPGRKTLLGRGPGLGLGKAKDWPLYPPACPPSPGHSYLKIFLTFACFACPIVFFFFIEPLLILHHAYGNSGTDRFSFWSRNNFQSAEKSVGPRLEWLSGEVASGRKCTKQSHQLTLQCLRKGRKCREDDENIWKSLTETP